MHAILAIAIANSHCRPGNCCDQFFWHLLSKETLRLKGANISIPSNCDLILRIPSKNRAPATGPCEGKSLRLQLAHLWCMQVVLHKMASICRFSGLCRLAYGDTALKS